MKRLLLLLLSCSLFLAAVQVSIAKSPPIEVTIDGAKISMPEEPYEEYGKLFVPLSPFLEKLDYTVTWDNNKKRLTAAKNEGLINIQLNQRRAKINGLEIQMEAYPRMEYGVIFVPLSFIEQLGGYKAEWNAATKVVSVISINSEEAIVQRLQGMPYPYLTPHVASLNEEEGEAFIEFQIDAQAVQAMSNSSEISAVFEELVNHMNHSANDLITTIPNFKIYNFKILWKDIVIYDRDFQIEEDVYEEEVYVDTSYDYDSEINVSISEKQGVTMQYKLYGKRAELPVLDRSKLTSHELKLLKLLNDYNDARNRGDSRKYIQLINEEVLTAEDIKWIESDFSKTLTQYSLISAKIIANSTEEKGRMTAQVVEKEYLEERKKRLKERSKFI